MSEPTSPPTPRGQLSLEVRDCEVQDMVATPATRASLHASKTSQPSGLRHVISSSPVEDSKTEPEVLSPPGFPATNSTSFKAPRMTQNFHTRSPSDMQSPVTQAIMKRRHHAGEGKPRRFEDLGSSSGISPIMQSQISPIKSRSLGRKNTPPSLPHPPPPAARRGAPSSPVDGMMSPATMFVEHAHEHDENHQHFAPEHFTSDSPPARKPRSGRRFSFEADDVLNSPHTSARRAQELAGSRLSGGSTDGGSSVGDSDADAKTYDEYEDGDVGEGSGRSYNTESKAESPERSATPRAEARAREWATRTPDEKKNDVARMFLRRKRLGASGARAAEARMREVRSPSDSLMSPVSKQLAMRPGAAAARNHVVRLGPPPESSYANPMPRTAPGSPGVLTPRSGALLRAAKASSSRRNNERKPKALDLRQGGGSNEWARGLQSPSDSLMSPVSKRIEARHTELQKKTSLSDDQLKGLLRGAIDAVSPSSKRALKNASRRRRMMDLSLHPDSPAGAPTPPGAFQSPPRSSPASAPEPPSPTPTPRRKLRMDTESKIESGLLSPMSQRAVQSKPRRRMMRQLQPPASPSATIPAVGRRGSGQGGLDLHSPPDPRGLAKAMLSRTKPKPVAFGGDGRRRSASAVAAPHMRMTHSPSDALTSPASRAVARVRAGSIPPNSTARRRLLSDDIPPPLEEYGRSVSSPVPGLPPPAYVPRNNSK